MLLILISFILLESIMFGIVLPDRRKKKRIFIKGALIAIFLAGFSLIHNNALIWGGFIICHIILFGIYLFYYYQFIDKIEKNSLNFLFTSYVRIPIFFYIIPVIAVLYVMIAEAKADEIVPVMVILFFVLIAGGYTFAENKKLNNLSDESIACMDQENLKQYIYRKNALIELYAIIFSISAGLLYICVCDCVDENILVLIFVLEFVVNMFLYIRYYHKIKAKYMPEDNSQYNRWQLMVPKKVGIGYTLNFNCPLTYAILGILFIMVVVSLL